MKLIQIIVLTGLLFSPWISSPVNAQSKEVLISRKSDYCGTKKTGRLVPDRPFGFDFSGACREHDICLNNGQDRNTCRAVFRQRLLSTCNSLPKGRETKRLTFITNEGRYSLCLKAASTYAGAVGIADWLAD